jgi:hypothetical protein
VNWGALAQNRGAPFRFVTIRFGMLGLQSLASTELHAFQAAPPRSLVSLLTLKEGICCTYAIPLSSSEVKVCSPHELISRMAGSRADAGLPPIVEEPLLRREVHEERGLGSASILSASIDQ